MWEGIHVSALRSQTVSNDILLSGHTGTVLVSEVAVGDFTVDLQFNEFHRNTQEELNDLIRDLDLPKSKAEIYCICTVHVIRSLNCQYQHMHNFNVSG